MVLRPAATSTPNNDSTSCLGARWSAAAKSSSCVLICSESFDIYCCFILGGASRSRVAREWPRGWKQVAQRREDKRTSAGPQVLFRALALAAGGDAKQRSGGACGQAEAGAAQACGGHLEAASRLCPVSLAVGTKRMAWGVTAFCSSCRCGARSRSGKRSSATRASKHQAHASEPSGAFCRRRAFARPGGSEV